MALQTMTDEDLQLENVRARLIGSPERWARFGNVEIHPDGLSMAVANPCPHCKTRYHGHTWALDTPDFLENVGFNGRCSCGAYLIIWANAVHGRAWVQWTPSQAMDDIFTRNHHKVLMVEERLAQTVFRPKSFVNGSFINIDLHGDATS